MKYWKRRSDEKVRRDAIVRGIHLYIQCFELFTSFYFLGVHYLFGVVVLVTTFFLLNRSLEIDVDVW